MSGDFTSGLGTAVTIFATLILAVVVGIGIGLTYLFNWLF